MNLDSNKIVEAKYYSNLYLSATKLVDKHIEKPFIIASNCISLIAGITFHLLKNYQVNYSVQYFDNELILDNNFNYKFIIVNKNNLEKIANVALYFHYEGEEPGIICTK